MSDEQCRDGTFHSKCPIGGCDHQIIGLSDGDEWSDLLDEHLRDAHDTTLYEWYGEPGTNQVVDYE